MKTKLSMFKCLGSFDLGKTGIKPPQPNLQSAVFIKVLQDIDGLEIRYVTIPACYFLNPCRDSSRWLGIYWLIGWLIGRLIDWLIDW